MVGDFKIYQQFFLMRVDQRVGHLSGMFAHISFAN